MRVDLDEVRRRLGLPTANDRDDWQQIRKLLSNAVDETVFAIWFEPLELVATDNTGELVLAGDPTVCCWVRSRFGPLLADCAQRAGRQLRVANEPEQRALAVSAVQTNQQEVS